MNSKLRISPSGPFLTNSNGGIFEPGPGCRLRLVEAACTIGGGSAAIPTAPTAIATTLGNTNFTVGLAEPDPQLNYRANVRCDVSSASTNIACQVELYLDTSVDAGATWTEACSNSHTVNPSTVSGTSRQIELGMTLRVGSGLSVTGAPQTAGILVRARIGASSGGTTAIIQSPTTPGDTRGVGSVHLSLEECF